MILTVLYHTSTFLMGYSFFLGTRHLVSQTAEVCGVISSWWWMSGAGKKGVWMEITFFVAFVMSEQVGINSITAPWTAH